MDLAAVLGVLRGGLDCEGADMTAHVINRNRQRAFGLFMRGRGVAKSGAVGGAEARGHEVLRLVLLLRWGRDGSLAEGKAAAVYNGIACLGFEHEGRRGFFMAVNEGPVWVGADERGVFEYALDFDVYYELEVNYGLSCEQH